MATTGIDIENDLIPEGYEAVRVDHPLQGEWYIGSSGTAMECKLFAVSRGDPRVIIRPLPEKTRPYNADEMRELVGSVLIHASGSRHIVTACSADGREVYMGFSITANNIADTLQANYTNLDGRKCEVVE